MLNHIKLENNSFLIKKEKHGGKNLFYFSNGEVYNSSELTNFKIFIKCSGLNIWFERPFRNSFLHVLWYSKKWHSITNNPFKGKVHSEDHKQQHSNYMKGRFIGEKNPFYGKKHSEETKQKISEKSGRSGAENGFYGKTHTKKVREQLSKKSKEYALKNLDKMSLKGIKSAYILSKGRKTAPEKILEEILKKLKINYRYNKIIKHVGQYDFIINDNILIEVHGDYWHANPKFFGDGKKPINERQQYKIKRDKEKLYNALHLGFSVVVFWEYDLKNYPEKIERQISCLHNMNWLK